MRCQDKAAFSSSVRTEGPEPAFPPHAPIILLCPARLCSKSWQRRPAFQPTHLVGRLIRFRLDPKGVQRGLHARTHKVVEQRVDRLIGTAIALSNEHLQTEMRQSGVGGRVELQAKPFQRGP